MPASAGMAYEQAVETAASPAATQHPAQPRPRNGMPSNAPAFSAPAVASKAQEPVTSELPRLDGTASGPTPAAAHGVSSAAQVASTVTEGSSLALELTRQVADVTADTARSALVRSVAENSATVELEPAGLGRLAVRVELEQGSVQVRMLTETDAARDLLRREADAVREVLVQRQLVVENLEIRAAGSSDLSLGREGLQQRQESGSGSSGTTSEDRSLDAEDGESSGSEHPSSDRWQRGRRGAPGRFDTQA